MKTKKILKFFGVVLIIVVLIPAGIFIFRNPIVDAVIEKTGAAIAGARVDVDGVRVGPFSLTVGWDRLQVADKDDTWTNVLETKACQFGLQFKPLLAGKFIIDDMNVESIQTGTKRESDGKIIQPEEDKTKEPGKPSWLSGYVKNKLEEEKKGIPVLNPELLDTKIDTDTIIAELELITPGNAEKLKGFADERYRYWKKKLESDEYKKKVKEIRREIDTIDLKKIKTFDDVERAIKIADKAVRDSKALRKQIKKDKKALKADLEKINNTTKQIPDWIKHDYETALKKAKLADISAENISMMLFGDKVTSGLMTALDYLEKSRGVATRDESEPADPKKDKMPHLPGLWIKKMSLSVILEENVRLSGVVNDISTSHKKTGKPLTYDLKGSSEKAGKIRISSVHDYRNDTPEDVVNLDVKGISLDNMTLPSTSFFPETIKHGFANFNTGIIIKGRSLVSEVSFLAFKIAFDYSSIKHPGKTSAKFARSVAEKVDQVNFKGRLTVDNADVDINFKSNLDDIISAEIKRMLTGEMDKGKKELRRKLDKKLEGYIKDLEKDIGVNAKELNTLLSAIDKDTAKEAGAVDRKKDQLEKKATKELERKAKKTGEELLEKFNLKF